MAVAAAIIGTVASVAGTVVSAMSANAAAEAQAEIARQNQMIAEENARRAIERSQIEGQERDLENSVLFGQQVAVQSASGVSGRSQLLARSSARKLGRLDTLRIRQAGEIEAYNFRLQAHDFAAAAEIAKAEGKNSLLAGFIQSIGGLTAGASEISKAKAVKAPTSFVLY